MQTTDNAKITIETTINSPIEKVWNAWTDATLAINWFGSDPNGKGLRANLDVRKGGRFEVTFKDSDQTEHTCSGVYAEVLEPGKLSFTWMWKSEPGRESFVTVLLTPAGKSTRMLFEHANLAPGSKHDYLNGWTRTFSKLERLLGQGA